MSLYVEDPMFFVNGVVPDELKRYISLQQWQDIVERLVNTDSRGSDCACYAEVIDTYDTTIFNYLIICIFII